MRKRAASLISTQKMFRLASEQENKMRKVIVMQMEEKLKPIYRIRENSPSHSDQTDHFFEWKPC